MNEESIIAEMAKLNEELNDMQAELEEIENELGEMCDNCEQLVDVGGDEEFWGATVHRAEWECPYGLDGCASKYGVCPERRELEERRDELCAEMGQKDARFLELEDRVNAKLS